MKLYIRDRIHIPQILPQQNNFVEFNLKREIVKKVGFTEEDIEKYDMKEDKENHRTTWSVEKDLAAPIEVEFTKQELDFLKAACEKISETVLPDEFWITVEKIYDEAQ